jgi:AmmeMemoRadiSam system protein A
MDIMLNDYQKRILIHIARLAIEKELGIERITVPLDEIKMDRIYKSKEYGSFVTLHKKQRLRGCIGYITPFSPLMDQIEHCAIAAAFQDPRFSPLTKDEYNDIDIEISLLSKIVTLDDIKDIKIGRDGLVISKPPFRGLLLPQVATEYGWTVKEFLENTCEKAGLYADAWTEKNVLIEKFSAYVFKEKNDFQ